MTARDQRRQLEATAMEKYRCAYLMIEAIGVDRAESILHGLSGQPPRAYRAALQEAKRSTYAKKG